MHRHSSSFLDQLKLKFRTAKLKLTRHDWQREIRRRLEIGNKTGGAEWAQQRGRSVCCGYSGC